MENPTYSEQDIQDYASGSYEGDLQAFEAYLQQHPTALAQIKQYQQLYNLLQTESIPSLSFNLADKVLGKTHQPKLSPEPKSMRLVPYLLLAIGIAAAVITFQYFFPGLSPAIDYTLLAASTLIMIVFLTGFYYIDMKRRQEHFAVWTTEKIGD